MCGAPALAALGALRILREHALPLNLKALLAELNEERQAMEQQRG